MKVIIIPEDGEKQQFDGKAVIAIVLTKNGIEAVQGFERVTKEEIVKMGIALIASVDVFEEKVLKDIEEHDCDGDCEKCRNGVH